MSIKSHTDQLTIRRAEAADLPALARIAERDSAALPQGALLVGEQNGEVRAALALSSGEVIADPFRRTAELVALLRTRADQMRGPRGRRPRVVARTVLTRGLVRKPA